MMHLQPKYWYRLQSREYHSREICQAQFSFPLMFISYCRSASYPDAISNLLDTGSVLNAQPFWQGSCPPSTGIHCPLYHARAFCALVSLCECSFYATPGFLPLQLIGKLCQLALLCKETKKPKWNEV
jgi:hypothetical protein